MWTEILEPPGFVQSLDLAFVITGDDEEHCCNTDGIRGDENGDGPVNVSDVTSRGLPVPRWTGTAML